MKQRCGQVPKPGRPNGLCHNAWTNEGKFGG